MSHAELTPGTLVVVRPGNAFSGEPGRVVRGAGPVGIPSGGRGGPHSAWDPTVPYVVVQLARHPTGALTEMPAAAVEAVATTPLRD